MAAAGVLCQINDLFTDSEFNAVGHFQACVARDVTPNPNEVGNRLPACIERTGASFRPGFHLSEPPVQLVLVNSFAPVKLVHAAFDFRVVGVPVFQQPTILFFLGFNKA